MQMCLHALQGEISSLRIRNGNSTLLTFGLPVPTTPHEHLSAEGFDLQALDTYWRDAYSSFNEDQLAVFNEIDAAVETKSNTVFFLNAVGGTGKTFLFNALLSKWRARRKIVRAVASTGIAALLLQCATTVHSGFKVPLLCMPDSSCSVSGRSGKGKLLAQANAILWDEAPMSGKDVVNCVDRLLRALTGNRHLLLGRKVLLFGGDFC